MAQNRIRWMTVLVDFSMSKSRPKTYYNFSIQIGSNLSSLDFRSEGRRSKGFIPTGKVDQEMDGSKSGAVT